jgi:hypothetical protein
MSILRKFMTTAAAAIALTAAPSAALAATAPATAGPTVINASTSQTANAPDAFPNHCKNDVCAHVTSINASANTVHVRVWPPNYGFFGHLELTVCGVNHNSGKDKGWPAGGRGHTFKVEFRPSCKYIATAWQKAGHLKWTDIGQVTFRVHASG